MRPSHDKTGDANRARESGGIKRQRNQDKSQSLRQTGQRNLIEGSPYDGTHGPSAIPQRSGGIGEPRDRIT
jgi:hypothetical protein